MSGWIVPDWPAPANIRALSTLRYGFGASPAPFDQANLGLNCGDEAQVVLANRAELRRRAELPNEPCWLRQVHGTQVLRVQSLSPSELTLPGEAQREADASVTSTAGCVLAILTADCLPVLFCSDDGSAIGAAHAGWRGLAAGVLEATVAALQTPPHELLVWLGPAAGPQAYEVGDEVRAAFLAVHSNAAEAFQPTRPGHYLCDLYRLARQRLARLGIDRIYGGEHCTIGDPTRFFSHRRDGRSGRMASLIWRTA